MAALMKKPRKERERQRHRQEILAAALTLFAEKGFHNVSMQEIAATAEFATGTLYNLFANKEDLFFEVLVTCAEEAAGVVLRPLQDAQDEPGKLAHFIRAHARVAREQADAIRVFLMERRGRYVSGGRMEAKRKEFDERMISGLAKVIAAGVRKGLFHSVDPVVAAKCLSAALESITLAAVENPQAGDLAADLKKVEAVFFKGLVRSSGGKA